MKFDQHQLAACMAPRPLFGVSGTTDLWSDPKGEFLSLQAAAPVYELLTKAPFKATEWPKPGKVVNSRLGYYLHDGGHDVLLEDWRAMIGWAHSQIGGLKPVNSATARYAQRTAGIPEAEQAAWKSYFTRSDAFRRQHDDQLAKEMLEQKQELPQQAPAPGGEVPLPEAPTGSAEDLALAATLISYQVPAGGWSKHVDYRPGARKPGMAWTSQENAHHYAGTFDNRATTKQLHFLAALQARVPTAEIKASVERGIDYLINAQFPNGGWPQCYPLEGGYHDGITLNDGAMLYVIETLQLVAGGKGDFAWIDAERKAAAVASLNKGVQALLQLQYKVNGKPTIWAAQYDAFTMQPVGARGFEVMSLSGGESVEVIRTLFKIRPVTAELQQSIESACAWFAAHALPVEQNASGTLSWPRFIDIHTLAPLFPGKSDGKCWPTLAELKKHNPVGYDYQVTKPADLPKWLDKWKKTLEKEAKK
jgi:PelA/Pel-15E family pectate lyase